MPPVRGRGSPLCFRIWIVSVQVSLRGTVFCAEAIPNHRFGDRFATIAPNDDGDCFAKTARNDTGLNGYQNWTYTFALFVKLLYLGVIEQFYH